MVSDSTAVRPTLTSAEAGALFGQTMGLVAVTAGLFALGAYLGRDVAYRWGWLFFIGSLPFLLGVNVAAQRSEQAARATTRPATWRKAGEPSTGTGTAEAASNVADLGDYPPSP